MKIAMIVPKIAVLALIWAYMPHIALASYENYGAGFTESPSNLSQTTVHKADINQADEHNYGAGYTKSPQDISGTAQYPEISISNFGAGFKPSPNGISGSAQAPLIYTSNYGAGFTPSSNIVNTFTYNTIPRNYGAGFRTYGIPFSWSGAGYRIYSLGWWR